MKVVAYFGPNVQMMRRLRNLTKVANLELTLVMPTDTRWYSHYNCLGSLAKARGSMQVGSSICIGIFNNLVASREMSNNVLL